jgi:hypothetical protein
MSVKSPKPVVYYIRPEDSADMQLHTSIDIDMRSNELEVLCRFLLLNPCSDDYLALIIPNMRMIQILESPVDSYLKLLSKSKQKYKLLEDCDYEYRSKGIGEKTGLRWLKCSRETIRLLAVSDRFLPVTRHGPVGWSNKGFINIHFIVITGVCNNFIELDIEIDPGDDYQDVLIRMVSTLASYDNCCMNYYMDIIGKGKLCNSDMPQFYLLPYLPTPLIINLMNLTLINSQGVSAKGIARLNWRAP